MHDIQQKLKAPKGQYNSFGKYKYRSCEDIVEAVKPLLPEHVSLSMSDEVINLGDRFYVKATASLLYDVNHLNFETGESTSVQGRLDAVGWAREPSQKKGMDESQITGTASSYARKYALNGLFAIDDAKDADTNEHRQQTNQATNNSDEYVFRSGKFEGKALSEIPRKDLESWHKFFTGKELKGAASEAFSAVSEYLK